MENKLIAGSNCYITIEGNVIGASGFIRKLKTTLQGYQEIGIACFGKMTWYRVHRLVAQYYIENKENKPFVNHIDGNKLNNHISNLEWVTHRENMDHAISTGLIKRGEDNPKSKFTEKEVHSICKLIEKGYRSNDIADTYGVPVSLVSGIRGKVVWSHISDLYFIPPKSRSLSCETIHWLCQRLEEKLTQGQIMSLTDNKRITKTLIKDVRRRRIYKDISVNYNF